MVDNPRLTLIRGGKMQPFTLGNTKIVPSPPSQPPFSVTATLFEEDTWRVLSADPTARPETTHPVRVMTDMLFDREAEPGSVVVQGNRWLAIIHDLDRDPSCKELWIRQALERVMQIAADRACQTLALPLLGSVHGCLNWQASLKLISECLTSGVAYTMPERVWLQVPPEHLGDVVGFLGTIK